ncbi:interleukin-31 receptor subunit alpha [Labrus bergylta]|uniref:interleukin-31 receptor subunit alpha n=1 Tax=Labrus bergylta TaxID=56723 RepID=UPI003314132C
MVGCTFQLDLSHLKFSSHISMLSLILASCTSVVSYVQASSVNCMSSKYQHCEIQPGGVHALDCFGEHHTRFKTCEWKPGNGSKPENLYTLIVQQPTKKLCKAYININEFITKGIKVFEQHNMTVKVFENGESTNCTKAVFSASPKSIMRCAAPHDVTFSRHSGGLALNVSWLQDRKLITFYSVRYKARSSPLWSEPLLQCQKGQRCKVENLTSSLEYNIQIQCVTNKMCSQCVWSDVYTVQAELTTQPVVEHLGETDIAKRKGQRQISLTWTFPAKEPNEGYHVTIWKASGEEPSERMKTTEPAIRLILSYSAYYLNISAFNNASTSPAVSQIIPEQEDETSMDDPKLNVEVHSDMSFTIYWKDNLIQKYVCYSAEWTKKGHKATHMSFYQNEENHRTISPLPEPLEPYRRYSVTLHTRPYKDTCNMKHINNSESTYGTTQFYFMEGSPVSAPTNISSFNVSLHSAVLQWSPIPEEDVRGFLLGYIIHYTDYHHTGTSEESNITVDPAFSTYELKDLESGTAYKVQLSGFTEAGEGVLSSEILFKTDNKEYSYLSSIISVFAVLAIVLVFGSQITKRAKLLLWPSIPNPGKSNAMQKIEGARELELLASISPLKVEEWETSSLQIVEREEIMIPASTSPSTLPLLHALEDQEDQSEMTCDWIPCDTMTATDDNLPDVTTETNSEVPRTDLQSSPFAFPSGYTTITMFQQVTLQAAPANSAATQAVETETEDKDLTVVMSRLDYVGQFSTSPILHNEGLSTIL